MPVVTVHVKEEGFQVSPELARQLGFEAGEEARVEIRRAPDSGSIRQLALRYAWRRLGDAVGVGEPEWTGERWIVPLKVRGHSRTLGALALSADGNVIADCSTSKEEMLEQLDAASAVPPVA